MDVVNRKRHCCEDERGKHRTDVDTKLKEKQRKILCIDIYIYIWQK